VRERELVSLRYVNTIVKRTLILLSCCRGDAGGREQGPDAAVARRRRLPWRRRARQRLPWRPRSRRRRARRVLQVGLLRPWVPRRLPVLLPPRRDPGAHVPPRGRRDPELSSSLVTLLEDTRACTYDVAHTSVRVCFSYGR
jgi:hypothetical protein